VRVKQRTNRLALAHQTEACLLPLGPSSESARESFPRTLHPRCFPPKGPPRARPLDGHRASRVSLRCRGCPRLVLSKPRRERKESVFGSVGLPLCCFRPSSTPFRPADDVALTGSALCWLSRLGRYGSFRSRRPRRLQCPFGLLRSRPFVGLMCRRTSKGGSPKFGPYVQTKNALDVSFFSPQGYPQFSHNLLKSLRR
jgi:hypothetical protein